MAPRKGTIRISREEPAVLVEFATYYGELSIHGGWAIHPPEAASFP
jgi:hypothetical protein